MFFIRQSAVSRNYTNKGTYLSNCKNFPVQLHLNSKIITSLNASFLHDITIVLCHTLINKRNVVENLLSMITYREGRTTSV